MHALVPTQQAYLEAPIQNQPQLHRLEIVAEQLTSSKLLNETGLQILNNERNSQKLQSLSDDDVHDKLLDIWSEIKMLTGALLHTGKDLQIQNELLKRFLLITPTFRLLTTNEIRHAFYLNAAGEYGEVIPHYNREINAEWVGQVLRAYVVYKRRMYALAGDQIHKALAPPPVPPKRVRMPASFYMEAVQRSYDMYCAGRQEWEYGWSLLYNFLRKVKLITCESRQAWWDRWWKGVLVLWQQTGAEDLYELMGGRYEKMPQHRRQEIRRAATFKGQYHALKELFAEFNAIGINNIFSEVQYRFQS
jgi:hypothetical protein